MYGFIQSERRKLDKYTCMYTVSDKTLQACKVSDETLLACKGLTNHNAGYIAETKLCRPATLTNHNAGYITET